MSVFYGVRLPDELSAKVEATGQGKTEVIVAALELYFGGKVEPEKSRKMIIEPDEKPKAEKRPSAKPVAREIPTPIEHESEAEVSAVSSGCRIHPGAGGFPKAGGWWCLTCKAVV